LCFFTSFGQPHYCVALALATAGLLAAEPRPGGARWRRLAAGLALLLLATWVNSAVPLIFGPVVVLRSLLRPRPAAAPGAGGLRGWLRAALDDEAFVALGLLVVAALVGLLGRLAVAAPLDPLNQGNLRVSRWPAAWARLASHTWRVTVAPHWPAYLGVAATAGLLLFVPVVRRRTSGPLRAALALTAGGLAYGLAMGTVSWVAANNFNFKYWIPIIFFTETALALAALAPLAALLPARLNTALCVLCGPALVAGVALHEGKPSRGRARAALDHMRHGVPLVEQTAAVLQSRATHLLGSYGETWVSAFYVNLVLHERGAARRVWGVSGRCHATWRLWGRMPPEDQRLAALPDRPGGELSPEVAWHLRVFFPPVEVVEQRPILWLLRPADEVPRSPTSSHQETLLASWHSGFFGPEGRWPNSDRWCGAGTGKLTLTNTSDHPVKVTLFFQPRTRRAAPSNLWIDSPLYCRHMPIHCGAPPHEGSFVVPPGKHVLCFSCDSPQSPDPHGLRPLYFCLSNIVMMVQGSVGELPVAP
jgi:hypothetical protein